MIPSKTRESRRAKTLKLPKNLERLYKEGKCRECAVVVTRMDFAKILGKFTKVKIQYESSTAPKTKQNSQVTSPNSNARLKSNENGMVLIHRNAYNQHPVKGLSNSKKTKNTDTTRFTSNILKENNRLKKPILKDKNANYNDGSKHNVFKQYGIVFENPLTNNNTENNCKILLADLLPLINESVLPSDEWCIDYFPKNDEPKDDKVYDRIAAELEDLMYNEKPVSSKSEEKPESVESKLDDFPSIMDILNDNSSENKTSDQSSTLEFKSNLESSDVEAMLLGKSNPISNVLPPTPMDVDNTDMGNLVEDVTQLSNITDPITQNTDVESKSNVEEENILASAVTEDTENPHSPSILDEALQKGIEEHLPVNPDKPIETTTEPVVEDKVEKDAEEENVLPTNTSSTIDQEQVKATESIIDNEISEPEKINSISSLTLKEGITHLVFKKVRDGACHKSVTCPKNLKYTIEIEEKSVEFIGAPKFISSLEDLQVLLQIVNETTLDSLYVLH